MKISFALALLAPLTLPLAAHAQTAAVDANAPDVAAPSVPMLAPIPLAPKTAATSDAFVWRFMPPVGSRWTMRSFVRASSDTKVPAMGANKAESIKFSSMQKLTADYDIISRDTLGATTIRLTLREMSNDMSYVSDGKTTKMPLAAATNTKAVNGATLIIKQASDGKVWGVVGMRAFQRKILQASGSFDAATIDQILDASPMNANNGMFKSFSQMSGGYPVSPIRVGESWNYDVSLPAQFPMALDITGTRTLKKLDADNAFVADSARMDGGSILKMPNVGAVKMPTVDFSRLVGAFNGTTRVQRSSGLPLEATANLSMSGSVSTQMPANANEKSQTITVPMNLTSATRVVLEPR